ncbi:hypothetical protein [Lacipirellula sp.]|uniref:hypothetical protein n=1 Tax=Lacipirellula sp. TaxID=2691419 RepID=UPI003D143FD1
MPLHQSLPLATLLQLPTFWICVWIGLLTATVAIIWLIRTRLRNIKPWQKCAILSLWVHVLLACLTATVQIAVGSAGGGPGYGPPIQVALLPDQLEAIATSTDATPTPFDEFELDPNATDVETVESADDAPKADEAEKPPAEPFEAPQLLAKAEPAPEPAAEETEDEPEPAAPTLNETDEQVAVETPPPVAEPASAPDDVTAKPLASADESIAPPAAVAEAPAASPVSLPRRKQLPAPYAARFAANRTEIVAAGGGNTQTEGAVRAALNWLAAAQSKDGRWDAKRHGAGREYYVLGQDRQGAGAQADTGVSGLALLAFLGAGHTHQEGLYQPHVGSGLEFLRRSQQPDGNLCGDAGLFAQMYCHSMASFAVSETMAMTDDERLGPLVRGATRFTIAAQHPTDGGWRYRPGDTGDTSQLGWQVMILRSAERCDVAVPPIIWTRVDRFLRQVERGQAGGLAVYRPEEARPTRTMTAEALYCRQLVTGRADGALSAAALREAIGSLSAEPPSTAQVNFYYWYYATLALHRAQHTTPEAGEAWRRWNDALTRTLLATQNKDGSWPETCIWAGYGGRVFTTALGAMCLEVYYRYVPPEESVDASDIAAHPDWQAVPPR